MRIDVITIFPEIFPAACGHGILRIAQEKGLLRLYAHDLRLYTDDPHGKVDDRPYGGGPGMVLMAQPVVDAVEKITAMDSASGKLILLTPQGEVFQQRIAPELAREPRLIIICGRYEGFDERIREILRPREISIGDYVLSGGEFAALVIIDCVVRLIPGVVGAPESLTEESFTRGLLDYPHYTRPREFRGLKVPDVLLSGNHEGIRKWRHQQALQRTHQRRPDLLAARKEVNSHGDSA
jgi:tRNA (guanine37-N1)-methyltransferase